MKKGGCSARVSTLAPPHVAAVKDLPPLGRPLASDDAPATPVPFVAYCRCVKMCAQAIDRGRSHCNVGKMERLLRRRRNCY
ncbi:hypothetical protein V6Z11_D07G142100 [Gossypium hirsutum]